MDVDGVLSDVAGQVAACKRCQLSFSRKKAVPGEGPSRAKIMLIGEGPGFYENEQGRPFVGASGSFLDELLQKAGVNRKAVFITNVVKCRPPGNRDPLPDELQACSEYLDRQIAAINPLIIVTLGRYSMSKFLNNAKISEVHGKPVWVRGRMIVPMFHPAAALHQPSLKASVEQDFARLPEFIKQAQSGAGLRHESGAQQKPGARQSDETGHEPAIRQQPVVGAQLAFGDQVAMEAEPALERQEPAQPASAVQPEPGIQEASLVEPQQIERQAAEQPGEDQQALAGAAAAAQQSLFGDLLEQPADPVSKSETEAPTPKGQPVQLSLF